ncbi:MAG: PorV/PorQ family protein [Elusimicrobia bacterium]|nr:PorV/PorQ family protein [Elusimicrobiota bacterium]
MKPVVGRTSYAARVSCRPVCVLSLRLSFLVLLLSALVPRAGQAAAGRTSMDFLKINASPRSLAMGETGAGLSDDAMSATYMNPAGIARLVYPEASFSYNLWVEDISLQHFSYAHPTRTWGSFGVSGTVLQVKKFEGYDNSGNRVGDVKAMDFAVKPVYARRILGPANDLRYGVFLGAAFKFAREELDTIRTNASMADAGCLAMYPLGPGVFGFGGAALSLGRTNRFDIQRDKPAALYRMGLSYTLPVFGDPFVLAGDVKMPVYDEFSYSAGLEYGLKRILFVRGGFISRQAQGQGWRVGLGIKAKFLQIDYAISEYGKWGYSHLMGLSVKFGEPIDVTPARTPNQEKAFKLIRRAKEFFKESRHYEAALSLNEALDLDPNNREALSLLREVRDALER